jgi:hypothetical protein
MYAQFDRPEADAYNLRDRGDGRRQPDDRGPGGMRVLLDKREWPA